MFNQKLKFMKTKLLFSACCALVSMSMFAALPTEKAYYPMSTDLKSTVGTFTAMDEYGVTYADDSKFGKVVDFDGTAGYVEMDPALYGFTAVTINIWFKARTVDTWSRIFTFGAGNGNQLPEVFFTPADGRTSVTPAFGVDLTAGGAGTTTDITDTVTTIDPDVWYMLTCCADIDFGYFYLDGKLIDKRDISDKATAPKDYTFDIAWLGKSGWPDPLFNGQMTKFRIYDKVLTADEIAELKILDLSGTSISNPSNANNINVYSNNNRIFINNLKSVSTVSVYDISGRQIAIKSSADISSTSFKSGIYLVNVSSKNGNYNTKVTIK